MGSTQTNGACPRPERDGDRCQQRHEPADHAETIVDVFMPAVDPIDAEPRWPRVFPGL